VRSAALCSLSSKTNAVLRTAANCEKSMPTAMPQSKPQPLGLEPSFGFGDRLGGATPGHVAALKRAGTGIKPIFAQQSIREMARTGRSPEQVMADAMAGCKGYVGIHGADADHLKTPQDVDRTAAAGFCFFTIDPSDHVDPQADDYKETQLAEKAKATRGDAEWLEGYLGKSIKLSTGTTITLDHRTLSRAAVKYGKAITHAVSLAQHIDRVMKARNAPYEIELSVDETPQPTTLGEHYVIADQCRKQGLKLISLAPRYVGDFEKGVDYKGDVSVFTKSLADHAALAQLLGPYKLSLHSGSDKLSIYSAFAKTTKGQFHVKTAGTSYLEALRVVARHDEELFRRVVEFGRSRYDTDRATYHVSAKVSQLPPASAVKNISELEKIYLGKWADTPAGTGMSDPGRQVLHCTFGSTLTHPELGPAVKRVVKDNPATYSEILEDHFTRHLELLKA
jgi:hypothetical protein